MNEYQDQDVWFEVWGYDGFRWEFIADFTVRTDAEMYADASPVTATYEQTRIRRVHGQAD